MAQANDNIMKKQDCIYAILCAGMTKSNHCILLAKCLYACISKVGNPQFISATLQNCGQPNCSQSCGLKKVVDCNCRLSKFDFRNSATLRSLLPVPPFSSPSSSAQDRFKNQPKIILELSVSLETKNLP
jgi:hypothetical protein